MGSEPTTHWLSQCPGPAPQSDPGEYRLRPARARRASEKRRRAFGALSNAAGRGQRRIHGIESGLLHRGNLRHTDVAAEQIQLVRWTAQPGLDIPQRLGTARWTGGFLGAG